MIQNTMNSSRPDEDGQREWFRDEKMGMKEYFVPLHGIDLVVITADIERYLGGGATVRVEKYEVTSLSPIAQRDL